MTDSLELIVGRKVLERFRKGNADRRAQGEHLHAAIRKIAESHVGLVPIRAEAVLALLPMHWNVEPTRYRANILSKHREPAMHRVESQIETLE